jgi:glycosyltransferase involved in cell wall biosynthesis
MSCGTPVVTSRSSALSEVGGDAVKYCNPKSPESIAEKIYEFISSEDEREKYSTKGLKRAENFSWKKCAEETLAVYKKVAGK